MQQSQSQKRHNTHLLQTMLSDEHAGTLKAGLGVERLELAGDAEHLQRLIILLGRMMHHAEVTVEQRAARIDLERSLEVILGKLELFLAVVDGAESVPGIVVARIGANGMAIAIDGL